MADSALKRLANAIKTPGGWIVSRVEYFQQSAGSYRTDPGWFHPSSLGSECDAQLAFQFLGAPGTEVISAQLRRIFDNGSGRDLWLKTDFHNAGISLIKKEEDRKILIEHLRIRGELDEWVENPDTKKRAVIDFKTMRDDLWRSLEVIKPDHHIQLHPYMYAKETFDGFIWYENKNTQEVKLKQGNFDGKIWQEITDRIERIINGLEQNRVFRTPSHCSQCPFFANGVCTANQIQKLKEASGLYDRGRVLN
jgi:CRISPR/Cas system-associated exonuclease Cas4 (RecB family)